MRKYGRATLHGRGDVSGQDSAKAPRPLRGPLEGPTLDTEDGTPVQLAVPRVDGWRVTYDLAMQDGRPVVVGLHVTLDDPTGDPPLGGLAGRVLRTVGVEGPVRQALQHFATFQRERQRIDPDIPLGYAAAFAPDPRRPGRPGRPPVEYAAIAAAYVESLHSTSSPIDALHERSGYDRAWVRELVSRARAKGMLTPAPRGRAGGELTDHARALLDTDDGRALLQRWRGRRRRR